MAGRHTPLCYAIPLLLLFVLAARTEAATSLQVNATAAATVSNTNPFAQALAKLLRVNGTQATVNVKPPFAFNASIPTDTLKMAGQLLQQLAKLQPLLNVLQQATANTGRGLLADDSGIALADTNVMQTMTATTANINTPTDQQLNNRKIAQRVNLVMSDAWLVAYSGLKVAQVSFQLLAAMLKAGATGTVTVDTALILQFSDVSTNFLSTVSYLLYGIQKLTADAVSPLGLKKIN
uniref:FAS1 domain-containing protein n=1 Tax=Tetradesmus obliquus TaxID=3088 RepID=A0A383VLM9_TETOB|eukprot:jgi/Sobl393_1/16578/SZX66448.1